MSSSSSLFVLRRDVENQWGVSPRKRMRLPGNSIALGRATNVTLQQHKVGRDERAQILGRHPGFRGCTIWFTGLSGAGKTTISMSLEKVLNELGIPSYVLDGDNVRHGLCKNLGFTKDERTENIRRVAEVSRLFGDMGVITLASFISPFQADRDEGNLQFLEVYVNTPLDICEARDTKKLYKKARAGELRGFTGIDSVYEVPENPDLVIEAGTETEAESLQRVLQLLYHKHILPDRSMQQLCGSPIRSLQVSETRAGILRMEAATLPTIALSLVDVQWLQVLAEGWASPLPGFMRERQYLQCLHHGLVFDLKTQCTEPGGEAAVEADDPIYGLMEPINQSVPIVLAVDEATRATLINDGQVAPRIALTFEGRVLAILNQGEIFAHRKEERIARQFGFTDSRHPTIQLIRQQGDWLLGGDLEVLERIRYNDGMDEYRLTPAELRERFTAAGADSVFAFQLRNPIHNGHALLMRDTRAHLLQRYRNPMLLLHPLGGWTKDDDVPLAVRIAQHRAVLDSENGGLLDPAWTVLAIFPSPMLYAGPTEVQWHARARLAAGITAYIVGRDPAGIQHPDTGDFLYDPTHGAKVLSMAPGLGHLEIVPFRVAAYDKTRNEMGYLDPQRAHDFLFISGTKMRTLARTGEQPPEGFMVPAAWKVLAEYYRRLNGASE